MWKKEKKKYVQSSSFAPLTYTFLLFISVRKEKYEVISYINKRE
ncbi:hypothetical protein A0O32_1609 [Anoxybacillus flavithermus]|nr:hypothetical protein A0O32_1609 [Anoxybacillus flavithermus]